MKIPFDQGVPAPLRKFLSPHIVSTAFEMGWSELENGALLAASEKVFDSFITTDKNPLSAKFFWPANSPSLCFQRQTGRKSKSISARFPTR